MSIEEKMHEVGIVPVVVIENAEDAVPLAKALLDGGVCFMEITLRTACAGEAISKVAAEVPDMIVGAGTVLNKEQAKSAIDAGAKFIVSPGFSESVVSFCQEKGIACCPGCVTPSEIMKALEMGLKMVKFFPANVYGGIKALKALAAPFGGVKFLPTGGINGENMNEYITADFVAAVGGSWICTKADIKAHEFAKITELSKQATEAIRNARK